MLLNSKIRLTGFGLALGGLLALAGCNTGDGASALNIGGAGGQQKAEKERVLASELEGFCPKVQLREGTAFFTTYTKGNDGDAANAIYQAAITDVTRSCNRMNGVLTLTVAAAGKVVPGPKADGKTISLPIRVAVVEGESVLYSQLQQFQVTIVAGQAATQFIFNDPNPSLTVDKAKAVQVFVGFDEGPQKPKKPVEQG